MSKSTKTDISKNRSTDKNTLNKKRSKASETKTARILTTIGVVSLLLGVLGLIALIGISLTKTHTSTDNIKIENVDPETANKLTRQIVYSSTEGSTDYYSPTLDVLITYSQSMFHISEGYDNILISPRGTDSDIYANMKIAAKDQYSDITQAYIDKYTEIYTSTEIISNETDNDGLITINLKYSKPSIIKGETEVMFRTILILELKDSFAVMDISETGGQSFTEKYLEEYTKIVQSTETSPQNIAPEIIVAIPTGNIQVVLDRKKWTVSSQSDTYLSASFISNEYEKDESLKWTSTSIFLYTYEYTYSVDIDATSLKDSLLHSLEQNKEQYADRGFNILENNGETTIGDLKFYYTKYEYDKLSGDKDVVTSYSAYNLDTKVKIAVTTHQPASESEGGKELEKVLTQITIESTESDPDEDTPASSMGPNLQVLGTSSIEIEKAAIIGKPAVTHIFNRSCVDMTISQSSGLQYSSGKTYNICTAGFGSGFYVNNDGNLVTNAHVAASNPTDIVIDGMFYGYDPDGFGSALMIDTISLLAEIDPSFGSQSFDDPEYQDVLLSSMVLLIIDGIENGYMTLGTPIYTNYAQKDIPFSIDEYILDINDKDQHLELDLIEGRPIGSFYETAASNIEESAGITTPDLALLKIKDSDLETYSAVRLSDPEKMNVGQSIYVFGFPGSAENETLFSASSTTIPTITRGTISAIKPSFNNAFDLVQVDASISHGNSGGPILNSDGHLVGVATYGISSESTAADFNAGISVAEVKKLLADNNVSDDAGPVTEAIENGIDSFAKGYYKWALEDFNEAKTLSSSVSDVLDPLIKIAEEKIAQGEDNSPVLTIGTLNLHKMEMLIAALVLVLVTMGILILVLISLRKKGRKGQDKATSVLPDIKSPSSPSSSTITPGQSTIPTGQVLPQQLPTQPQSPLPSPVSKLPSSISKVPATVSEPAQTQVPVVPPPAKTPTLEQSDTLPPTPTATTTLPQPLVTPPSPGSQISQLPGSPLPQDSTPTGEISPMNGVARSNLPAGNTNAPTLSTLPGQQVPFSQSQPTAPTDTPAMPSEPDTPDVPSTPVTPTVPTDTPAVPTDTPAVPTDTPAVPTDTPAVPDTPFAPTIPTTKPVPPNNNPPAIVGT